MLSVATRTGASAPAASLLPRKLAGLGDAGDEQLASYTPAARVPSDSARHVLFLFLIFIFLGFLFVYFY